ncbi:TlpA disulfide reductase family protein [Chitinophaga sancti]|uniref:Peroxiredoxin n=1 Tax=Chitinophaga sancti TaxID=1004 RepID=A0A1K1SJQ3_9BACT|nr:TlpA disulfide reductase family protein [Chitinophaga sancti]WQD64502.1 TlpA disulfide reductase family protein [Chitinophaga sancti]WQG89874.1 TlpA disulfide reductase family protein [Chitinophaga sancti]SFW84542.1 Peroxiredoxin [Chitinophaga sancti]
MMSKVTMLLVVLAGSFGIAKAQQHFVIKGKLGHVKEPAKVYIMYFNRYMQTDSAEVRNNEFTLSGVAGLKQRVNIFLRQGGQGGNSRYSSDQLAIYLEEGVIEVSSPDSLLHAKLGGSQLNKDQQELISSMGNVKQLQAGIIAQFRSEPDSVKRMNLMEDYKQLDVLLQTNLAGFIQSHPNSLVAMHALRSNFNPVDNVELATNLFNSMSDSIKASSSGELYKESIENVFKLSVGKPAPDFVAKDLNGTEKHLSDFKGKYVLLDFWASWCGPCRRESPNLVESYAKFSSKQFEIISFSVDKEADDWKKAVEKDQYTWTNLVDYIDPAASVAKLYGITALPTNFLLDPSGKIIALNLRGEELAKQLTAILN